MLALLSPYPPPCTIRVSSFTTSASPWCGRKVQLNQSSFHGIRLQVAMPIQRLPIVKARAVGVRMMAKREEELKEIRTKSTDEINEEVVDLKGELLMLRLQRSARNEFKSSEFRRMRKKIARMLTVKREREIEEGINKRLSRKMDRKWKRSIVVRPPPSLRKKQEEEKKEADAKSSSA
ncbi:50S ribosomal protein L29 [Zostera marina]|uniref:Large ribosomal subunit protein uL29c n=1 Tax=Zostera marina TaxID=29655 RepID=A0A0K9NTJ9_ZOSMR|nr:50S ribosomal protein L29 [Zostera marina]